MCVRACVRARTLACICRGPLLVTPIQPWLPYTWQGREWGSKCLGAPLPLPPLRAAEGDPPYLHIQTHTHTHTALGALITMVQTASHRRHPTMPWTAPWPRHSQPLPCCLPHATQRHLVYQHAYVCCHHTFPPTLEVRSLNPGPCNHHHRRRQQPGQAAGTRQRLLRARRAAFTCCLKTTCLNRPRLNPSRRCSRSPPRCGERRVCAWGLR
jgi:hypothetical protein